MGGGTNSIWIRNLDKGKERQLTDVTDRGIDWRSYWEWANNGQLLYLKDNNGDENHHLFPTTTRWRWDKFSLHLQREVVLGYWRLNVRNCRSASRSTSTRRRYAGFGARRSRRITVRKPAALEQPKAHRPSRIEAA